MVNNNLKMKRKMKLELIFFCIGFLIISIKLAYVQFVKGEEYSKFAIEQLNTSRTINANRGFIYDANGIVLASSSTVYSININPVKISVENKEKVAKTLSDIFKLDYEDVLKKINQNVSVVNIVKKVEKEDTDKLRNWMNQTGIDSGINIDEDTKRYYPFESLASHIIRILW